MTPVKYDANKQNAVGTEIDQGWGKIWAAEEKKRNGFELQSFLRGLHLFHMR